MILIGYVTDTSVALLFLAGIVPGLLIGVSLMIVAYRHARKGGAAYLPATRFTSRHVLKTAKSALPGLGLPFIIVFGILAGIFTATEAAVAAAVYGLLVGLLIYREITWRDLPGIFLKSAEMACVVMFIAATAQLFAWLITVKQVPALLQTALHTYVGDRTAFLILLNLALLLIGMFLESFSAVIVFVPILFPMAQSFGIDPVHFGIIATVNLAIGYITPPYGATLFVACGLSGQSVRAVSARVLPILLAMVIILILVTYVPGSFMWIPDILGK